MKEVIVSDKMFLAARKKSIELGKLKNSILNGNGNLTGFIGEFISHQIIGGSLVNEYDYDLIYKDIKIDIKTKLTTVKPLSKYDCSIAKFNTKQNCDVYVFTRVLKNYQKGWVLGWLPKQEYFDEAIFLKKGDIDKSNNFKVKADCYNVKIFQLYDINKLRYYKKVK